MCRFSYHSVTFFASDDLVEPESSVDRDKVDVATLACDFDKLQLSHNARKRARKVFSVTGESREVSRKLPIFICSLLKH